MRQTKKVFAGFLCGLFTVAHILAVSGLVGAPDAFKRSGPYQGGWEERGAVDRRAEDPDLVWSVPEWDGVGEGQTRLLYKDYEKVHGKSYVPRTQGRAPSCVG